MNIPQVNQDTNEAYHSSPINVDTDSDSQPSPLPHTSISPPPGYTIGTRPDGVLYVVPKFMVQSTELALDTAERKELLHVRRAAGGVSNPFLTTLVGISYCGPHMPMPMCRYTACPTHVCSFPN